MVTGTHDGENVSFELPYTPDYAPNEVWTVACTGTYTGTTMSGTLQLIVNGASVATGEWKGRRRGSLF